MIYYINNMNITNINFYNELSYCLSNDNYKKLNHITTTKKQYLHGLLSSPYKKYIIPHIQLEDFIYIYGLLDNTEIVELFKQVCCYGYENKIIYMCYYTEFYNTQTSFHIDIINSVIPHQNINLISYLLDYFCCTSIFRYVFRNILIYNTLCLELFNLELMKTSDDIMHTYILQTIHMDRYKIFAYLFDFFKIISSHTKHRMKCYIIDIMDKCICENKLKYIKYINSVNPLNKFYKGLNIITKIQTFETFDYLRKHVMNPDAFERKYFYHMIEQQNVPIIKQIIDINPYLICMFDHKAIYIALPDSLKVFLKSQHPCDEVVELYKDSTPSYSWFDKFTSFF